jgi:hypothetical protein
MSHILVAADTKLILTIYFGRFNVFAKHSNILQLKARADVDLPWIIIDTKVIRWTIEDGDHTSSCAQTNNGILLNCGHPHV